MDKFELIVVDMDGVLANFRKGVAELFNVPLESLDEWQIYKSVGLDLDTFWQKIAEKKNFWINLERFPYVDEFMDMIEKYSSKIVIYSHPPGYPDSYRQKKEWLGSNNLSKYRHFIGNANKGWFAYKNRVLIDDHIYNIRNFEKKGGKGILFPQVYSLQYIENLDIIPDNKVTYIEDQLKQLLYAIEAEI